MTTTIADQPISLCVKKETIKSLKHQVSALQDQAKDLTEKLAKKELNDSSTPVGINIEGGFKGDVSSEQQLQISEDTDRWLKLQVDLRQANVSALCLLNDFSDDAMSKYQSSYVRSISISFAIYKAWALIFLVKLHTDDTK